MAELIARYPPAYSAQYVQASSQYDSNYYPWYAVNPSTVLTGYSIHGNAWLCAAGAALPQKFGIYFGEQISVSRIVLNNYHSGGVYTEAGVKTCRVYGGNDAVVFANISNTSDLTELTLLGEFVARQHVAANDADPQVFAINAPGLWSYVVIIPVDSWGVYNYVGFRRIEIQSSENVLLESRAALHLLHDAAHIPPALSTARSGLHILHGQAAMRRSAIRLWFASTSSPRTGLHLLFEQRPTYKQALHMIWDNQVQARSAAHLQSAAERFLTARAALHMAHAGLVRSARSAHLSFYGSDPVETRAGLHLAYQAVARIDFRAALHLLHNSAAPATAFAPAVVIIAGVRVHPLSLRVVEDVNQAADTAVLEFAAPLPAALATARTPVHITVLGISYRLQVESCSRDRAFAERRYTLTASSRAIRLQGRYAEPVHGGMTGLASALAASLCGSIPMHWHMVDWLVLPLRWQATGQAPLDLLRDLVSAAGGLLTSARDGSLTAIPWPPEAPDSWPDHVAAQVDTRSSIYSLADDADARDLCNLFTVSDEMPAEDQFRFDEDREKKQGAYTEVLVYQTPWDNDFEVSHRGDAGLVALQELGVEERVVEEELVEIKDGEGRTQFPVYELIRLRWNKTDLGSITHSEDGRIETGIEGESLLFLTYRTRARRYQVYMGPGEPEPLMLVAGG